MGLKAPIGLRILDCVQSKDSQMAKQD